MIFNRYDVTWVLRDVMYVTHQVVLLAVDLAVDVVEGLAAQRAPAAAADEAVGVVQVAHRLARVARTSHLLAARETLTCQHDVTFTNLVVTDVKKDQADEGKQRKLEWDSTYM